jgi:recombination protein RecA
VLKDNEGITVKVKVVKNKVAPPFRLAEFDVIFGSGIDKYGCILDAAETFGIVERKGSWYSKGDLRFSQGRRPAIDFLKSNLKLADEIEKEVRAAMLQKAASIGIEGGENEFEDEEGSLEEEPIFE